MYDPLLENERKERRKEEPVNNSIVLSPVLPTY